MEVHGAPWRSPRRLMELHGASWRSPRRLMELHGGLHGVPDNVGRRSGFSHILGAEFKVVFCSVCAFRVGFDMCYRTHRSSG